MQEPTTPPTPKKRAATDTEGSERPSKKATPPNGKTTDTAENAHGSKKTKKVTFAAGSKPGSSETITTPKKGRGLAKTTTAKLDMEGAVTVTPKKGRGLAKPTTAKIDMEGAVPVMPKKGKSSKAKAKIVKTKDADMKVVGEFSSTPTDSSPTDAAANNASPTTGVKTTYKGKARKRNAPRNAVAIGRGIPVSWDAADDADKMLVNLKNKGEDWHTIRGAWTAVTGQPTAGSTLPNRFRRMMAQWMKLEEGDVRIFFLPSSCDFWRFVDFSAANLVGDLQADRLLAAKAEVESKFHSEKFGLMAAIVERAGGAKYPALFIEKQLKELESAHTQTNNTRDDLYDAGDEADETDEADD